MFSPPPRGPQVVTSHLPPFLLSLPRIYVFFFFFMNSCGFVGSLGSMNVMSTVLSSLKSTGFVI